MIYKIPNTNYLELSLAMSLSIKSETVTYRPIMDDMQRIMAYEFISKYDDAVADAQSVIINVFRYIGMNDLFRGGLVFVNATAEFLMCELPLIFPENQLVFKLPPSDDFPDGLAERIKELSNLGYDVALEAYDVSDTRRPFLDAVSHVLIDINNPAVVGAYAEARFGNSSCIATKVDSQALLAKAQAIGFTFFQGNYFAHASDAVSSKPNEQHQTKTDSKLDVLDLLAKLNSDGSDKTIEDFFKAHPMLTIQMLRLVNAASTGNIREINSIHQALLLLGRAPLMRYFQVLLYSLDSRYACPNPLMAAATWRGKFMEIMVRDTEHKQSSNLQDQAYMVGLLSMMSALFNQDLAEILSKFNLSCEISQSILAHTGMLGNLLKIAEGLQFESLSVVESQVLEQGYSVDALMNAQNEAFAWVQNFQSK